MHAVAPPQAWKLGSSCLLEVLAAADITLHLCAYIIIEILLDLTPPLEKTKRRILWLLFAG